MNPETSTVAEITTTAVSLLCREIGPVNTARFINQFTQGTGNYTQERERLVGNTSVREIMVQIKQRRDHKP